MLHPDEAWGEIAIFSSFLPRDGVQRLFEALFEFLVHLAAVLKCI